MQIDNIHIYNCEINKEKKSGATTYGFVLGMSMKHEVSLQCPLPVYMWYTPIELWK